jgi:hypothetical protein
MQTMLRANIDASIAQDAFAAVVNRMDVTVEASMGLGLRLVSGVAQFYLRDTLRRSSGTVGMSREICSYRSGVA